MWLALVTPSPKDSYYFSFKWMMRASDGDMSHAWTMKFIEHRVADRRILRLIRKWLKAGISEDGQWSETKLGTPQGAVASPLIASSEKGD